jgi:hypothetical protein
MPIDQIRFASAPADINRKATRLPALALVALSTLFSATAATAAGNSPDANARYQAERAVCNSGRSNQDRATCLKEAGAALEQSKMGRLDGGQDAYDQNALIRCNALPADDRDACQRRIKGEGMTSGSVPEGGLVRELVVPDSK